MPIDAIMPPSTPKKAPNRKPLRRPTRAMSIDAGNIIKAVPKNIEAIGSVASVGVFAIFAPAKPPMVMTMTETVWKSDWELAKINTWRCMVF
ncbi:Uncharacterised protein [Acinetobacter baumannii]|nr:Uncharacterised protein [Acinetobacter baumannii]